MSILTNNVLNFPSQKVSDSKKKSKKWIKELIDAAEGIAIFSDNMIRSSKENMKINYDLYNDILDPHDVERITNPFKIKGATFPARMQNYPIANPKINLLLGEEYKRRFDWRVRVGNEDAISDKEKQIKEKIFSTIMEMVQSQSFDEQEAQKKLKDLEKWRKFEFQDLREQRATHLLKYVWNKENLKHKFNQGFFDALIAGDEIYAVEISHSEPVVRKVNPKNLYTVRSGDSPNIEDSDIFVEEIYKPIGQVIDEYHEELSDQQIAALEQGKEIQEGANNLLNYNFRKEQWSTSAFLDDNQGNRINFDISDAERNAFGGAYDSYGNIRVLIVTWVSLRKMQIVTKLDEFGQEYSEVHTDKYKPNSLAGETSKTIWIKEYRRVHKVGNDMILRNEILPRLGTKFNNPSICLPPYVGSSYNVNDTLAMSIMDRMKPFQYMYNVIMYRTELAFAKNAGKIAELDMSKIPDGWDMDKWLYYAQVMGWAPIDPFKEGKKGAAQGKLAGNFNTTNKVLDMETGQYIQNHIQMLEYIEQKMSSIVGVTREREGAIHQNQTASGVERSVTQSSLITEPLYVIHDNIKLRVLSLILETAKYAYRGQRRKLQYISDEMTTQVFDLDGDEYCESEYDIHVSNSSEDAQLLQVLKELAHAGIQNDKISFSQLMDIYTSDSISSVRRKIETAEEDALQRAQEAAQAENELRQKEIDTKASLDEMKIQSEDIRNMRDNDTKIEVALINKQDDGNVDVEKVLLEAQKFQKEYQLKEREQKEIERSNRANEQIARDKIKADKAKANKPSTNK